MRYASGVTASLARLRLLKAEGCGFVRRGLGDHYISFRRNC